MATAQTAPVEDTEEEQFALPRKDRDETEMDITPMIDITFLLLIFFLVASKMEQSADVDLPPAQYGVPASNKESIIVIVRKKGLDSVEVSDFDGNPFSDDIEQQEKDISDYVVKGLEGKSPFAGAKTKIMLKAEPGVKHGDVARVSKAIAAAIRAADKEIPTLHIAVLEAK
ncbi:MAG: biopolymer transport protein ExbD [Pirellulaceae bacterium]|jgi:biopolymer transport protein ExbD